MSLGLLTSIVGIFVLIAIVLLSLLLLSFRLLTEDCSRTTRLHHYVHLSKFYDFSTMAHNNPSYDKFDMFDMILDCSPVYIQVPCVVYFYVSSCILTFIYFPFEDIENLR